MLGTAKFGCIKSAKSCFLLVNGRKGGEKKLWVARVLLPFRVEMSGGISETEEEEFVFGQ